MAQTANTEPTLSQAPGSLKYVTFTEWLSAATALPCTRVFLDNNPKQPITGFNNSLPTAAPTALCTLACTTAYLSALLSQVQICKKVKHNVGCLICRVSASRRNLHKDSLKCLFSLAQKKCLWNVEVKQQFVNEQWWHMSGGSFYCTLHG